MAKELEFKVALGGFDQVRLSYLMKPKSIELFYIVRPYAVMFELVYRPLPAASREYRRVESWSVHHGKDVLKGGRGGSVQGGGWCTLSDYIAMHFKRWEEPKLDPLDEILVAQELEARAQPLLDAVRAFYVGIEEDEDGWLAQADVKAFERELARLCKKQGGRLWPRKRFWRKT